MSRIKSYYYDEHTEELKLTRVFSSILAFWVLSGVAFLFFYEDRGEFGDMFGSVNTLFSGLAFGGIIYTIFQQKIELKLQREELKLQRQEVEKTNKELAKQVEAMNIQRFETTFFNMLSLHHQLVNSIEVRVFGYVRTGQLNNPNTKYSGRSVFEHIFQQTKDAHPSNIVDTFRKVIKGNDIIMKQYYKNLTEIVNLVRNTAYLSYDDRIRYTRLISSQLSPAECAVIFYYTLWKSESEDFSVLKILIKDSSDIMPIGQTRIFLEFVEDADSYIAI